MCVNYAILGIWDEGVHEALFLLGVHYPSGDNICAFFTWIIGVLGHLGKTPMWSQETRSCCILNLVVESRQMSMPLRSVVLRLYSRSEA